MQLLYGHQLVCITLADWLCNLTLRPTLLVWNDAARCKRGKSGIHYHRRIRGDATEMTALQLVRSIIWRYCHWGLLMLLAAYQPNVHPADSHPKRVPSSFWLHKAESIASTKNLPVCFFSFILRKTHIITRLRAYGPTSSFHSINYNSFTSFRESGLSIMLANLLLPIWS